MKASKPKSGSQGLPGEIRFARHRLTQAESSVSAATEQARLARRWRKEAKRAARRARKQLKRATAELAAAKQALAKAQQNLAQAGKQARGKRATARRTAKAPAGKPKGKNTKAAARRIRKVRLGPAGAGVTAKRANPRRPKSAARPMSRRTVRSITVPRERGDMEKTAGAPASLSGSDANTPVISAAADESLMAGGHST